MFDVEKGGIDCKGGFGFRRGHRFGVILFRGAAAFVVWRKDGIWWPARTGGTSLVRRGVGHPQLVGGRLHGIA